MNVAVSIISLLLVRNFEINSSLNKVFSLSLDINSNIKLKKRYLLAELKQCIFHSSDRSIIHFVQIL